MTEYTLMINDDQLLVLQKALDYVPPIASQGLISRVNAMLFSEAQARNTAQAAAAETAAQADAQAEAQRAAMAASRDAAQ